MMLSSRFRISIVANMLTALVLAGSLYQSTAFINSNYSTNERCCTISVHDINNISPEASTQSWHTSASYLASLGSFLSEPKWCVTTRLDRKEARSLLDDPRFLPSEGYGDRIVFGRQAADREHSDGEMSADEAGLLLSDDPRLARTYAEFPLTSLDLLLDTAVVFLPEDITSGKNNPLKLVDIGSGLGRIVLYSALTRGAMDVANNQSPWEVCGIEISPSLHNRAMELVQTGVDSGLFEVPVKEKDSDASRSSVSFHCGSACDADGIALLQNAQLVFAYSTAFAASGFDPNVGALILDNEEWSLPLSEACPDGCVAITTDRALDPKFGWKVVKRIEVPNPEVLGTTGFIHVLEKSQAKGTNDY